MTHAPDNGFGNPSERSIHLTRELSDERPFDFLVSSGALGLSSACFRECVDREEVDEWPDDEESPADDDDLEEDWDWEDDDAGYDRP